MSTFGPLLRQYRERANISMAKLATRAMLDKSYVSRLEASERQPTRDVVARLADELRLSASETNALFLAAGFAMENSVSPGQLSEARQHVVRALELMGGA
jgi:transcriptional regulator with XRE-family HTH domain